MNAPRKTPFREYTDSERAELYRRVWQPVLDREREEAIKAHMIVVETNVGKLLWKRQNTSLEKDDLLQVGYVEMIHSIDRPAVGPLPLDKRITRNVQTAVFRYIAKELRERRYSQRGGQKAIRDTDAGNQAGDVDGGLDEHGVDAYADGNTAPARVPPSIKNRDFPNSDDFVYRSWLRGSVSVYREAFMVSRPYDELGNRLRYPRLSHVYGFRPLAPKELYIQTLLDNFSARWISAQIRTRETRKLVDSDVHPAFPWESSWHKAGTTWQISPKSGVRIVRIHRPRGSESRLARTLLEWGATIGPVRAGSVFGLPKSDYRAWLAWRRAIWCNLSATTRTWKIRLSNHPVRMRLWPTVCYFARDRAKSPSQCVQLVEGMDPCKSFLVTKIGRWRRTVNSGERPDPYNIKGF